MRKKRGFYLSGPCYRRLAIPVRGDFLDEVEALRSLSFSTIAFFYAHPDLTLEQHQAASIKMNYFLYCSADQFPIFAANFHHKPEYMVPDPALHPVYTGKILPSAIRSSSFLGLSIPAPSSPCRQTNNE